MASSEPEDFSASKEVEGPISAMTATCDSSFMKSIESFDLNGETPHGSMIKGLQEKFLDWAAYLGVFAGATGSLDYRLRRHPQHRDLILLVLNMLNMNLLQSKIEKRNRTLGI